MKSWRAGGDRLQPLAVVDDVDPVRSQLGQLGVLAAQLVDRHPVDVAGLGVRRASSAAGAAARSRVPRRRGSGRRTRRGRRGRGWSVERDLLGRGASPPCRSRSSAAGYRPSVWRPARGCQACGRERSPIGRRRDPQLELAGAAAALPRFAARTRAWRSSCWSSTTAPATARSSYLEREGVPQSRLPRNVGFAAAVNLGVARTAAATVLVLNADTVLEPGCLGAAARRARSRPDAGRRAAAHPAARGRRQRAADLATARLYSAGQALTADGRAFELGRGSRSAAAAGAPRGLRRLRRRLPAAPRAVRRARRLRRELLRLLRGRRPQRARADRRLALRVRPGGGRLARRQRLLAGGLRAPRRRERAPGRPQPARHPGQVHAARAIPRIAAVEAGALLRAAAPAALRGDTAGQARRPAPAARACCASAAGCAARVTPARAAGSGRRLPGGFERG